MNLVYDININGNPSYDLRQAFATDVEYSAEDVYKSVTPYMKFFNRYQAKLVGRIFPDMEAPGLPLEAVAGDAQGIDEDDPMERLGNPDTFFNDDESEEENEDPTVEEDENITFTDMSMTAITDRSKIRDRNANRLLLFP